MLILIYLVVGIILIVVIVMEIRINRRELITKKKQISFFQIRFTEISKIKDPIFPNLQLNMSKHVRTLGLP